MLLTSILRTVVPVLWGSFIAVLIGALPILAPLEDDLKGLADIILPILTAVIIAAWYAFWRWFEPRLPDWLKRAVLGSAKTPNYDGKQTSADEVTIPRAQLEGWHNTPPLTGTDWRKFAESLPASQESTALLSVADALDRTPGPDHRA